MSRFKLLDGGSPEGKPSYRRLEEAFKLLVKAIGVYKKEVELYRKLLKNSNEKTGYLEKILRAKNEKKEM
jgi:hypothetical protein